MELTVVSTVLVPATPAFRGQQAYDLVSLADVKSELDIDGSGKDDAIKRWITQASAAAAKYCNRIFAIETVQDRIFPPRDRYPVPVVMGGEEPLQLKRSPIAAPMSLAATAPPLAPVLSAVSGGSLPGTFYCKVTYVTPTGETAASLESQLTVATGLLQVFSPPGADSQNVAIGWNCYLGTQSFGEILQNAAPLSLGTPFTLPTTGLVTDGTPLPAYVLVVEKDVPLAEGVDFLVKADVGQLIRLNVNQWPKRWPALRTLVQYPAGYDFADPDFADVQDAVTRMVKARRYSQRRDPALRARTVPGVIESTFWFASGPGAAVGNMTPDVEALLERFRAPVFG